MAMLPSEFSDLEPYAAKWSLEREQERWDARLSSTIDELQQFYDAALPRVEGAIKYIDQFSLDDMPEDAANLMRLIYSFMLISFAVEQWRQPNVPDTGATRLDRIYEPLP
jgi:hypothetical protein